MVCDEIYRDLTYEPERFCSPTDPGARSRLRHHRPQQEHGARRLAHRPRPFARRAAPARSPAWRSAGWRARSGRAWRRRCSTPRSTSSLSRRRSWSTSRRAVACTARSPRPRIGVVVAAGATMPAAERRVLPLPGLRAAARHTGRACRRGALRAPARGSGHRRAPGRGVRGRSRRTAFQDGHEPALRRQRRAQARGAGERRPGVAAVDRRGARPHA